ncbi:hypothetical protein RirG_241820 [Rhizophagus irregularis DAOM 197198w]|uniref:Protein far1-related sequence 11-like n=1 Tax=Rhizophagus irregularis (strain DAOM 197198w) TaxID=1432141 RepID=A0A015I917_RHIIW|nr:hypothetical protein RirG_241820 [Rhizophagus irregularis DAOM 197198w]
MSHESELPSLDTTDSSLQNESNSGQSTETLLYKGRVFTSWNQAFYIIESWAKQQGFNIIYNRVERNPDRTLRKRTIQCEHQGDYNTKSNGKQTKTKRIGCTWHINLSELFSNNPSKHHAAKLYAKLLESSQNNPLWKVAIKFDDKNTLTHLFWMAPLQIELWYRYSDIVIQDVTCKTNRYDMALSLFVILDENRNIRLVAQVLLIDETKESHEWAFKQINLATNNIHPQVMMTDADLAVHAAIRSTFHTTYPMHCTFHINQNLIKKLQKLLGKRFYEFSTQFYATCNTLHKPIFESKWQTLINQYPEAKQYLTNTLYNTKEAWAHPWTCRKFTAGLHASSPVESINAWIKNYIFNSNISLCELAEKAAIPCISTQISIPSFMFTSIDKKLEEYLPPAILDLQRNEIRQCVFYSALQVNQEVISEFEEYQLPTNQHLEDIPDARQITASCMISDVNKNQIMSMWTVAVENKLVEKHFVILLTNGSHYCSCLSLINKGIICRHYFQIMLCSPTAKFHLKLIPSRWYYRNKDASKEPFLVASKFESDTPPIIPQHNVPFLTVIHQISQNSITLHERLTDIQLYGKITGLTHKATIKALKKKDMRIISILEDYLKDEEQNENVGGDSELDDDNELDGEKLDDELDDEFDDDKENHENHSFILNNPNKQTKSKGRLKGTKRIKASHEKNSSLVISKQYKCSQCGSMGHNKRNCSRK